jgi:hypothetical protein
MEIDRELDSAQKVSRVIDALKAGSIKVRREDEAWVKELLALPRGVTGLVDISKLSAKTLATARATALALAGLEQEVNEKDNLSTFNLADAQCTLFRHYEDLFYALIGTASGNVESIEEIKARMLDRLRHSADSLAIDSNAEAGLLEQFYHENSGSLFRIAKSIGGVKVVLGGQRQFGSSALAATRIAGLYCDTQLIPDPIYPFFFGELHLNALHLQLAINLFHILPLRPLIDARLAVPPILVFPSFEEPLEDSDAITQAGIASLLIEVVGPVCDPGIKTAEELFEYAKKNEQAFLDGITREKLFIPPGVNPESVGSAADGVHIYLKGLEGRRDERLLDQMRRLPRGVLVLNAILERLRPQYHLMENAGELGAQPLLSLPAHWHYFERCSQAETRVLVNEKILSKEAFDILRALQDDSLTWLANIPVSGLTELRERMEHVELREHLKKVTAQLTAAGPAELESVVREVRHGLEVLIQRQQKAIKDIEDRYSPKNWTTGTKSVLGAIAGASVSFMPSLAAITGVTTPIATALGALSTGGLSMVGDAVGRVVEKRKAKRTMLGMLAKARSTS